MPDILERLQDLKSSIKTVNELNIILAAQAEITKLRKQADVLVKALSTLNEDSNA